MMNLNVINIISDKIHIKIFILLAALCAGNIALADSFEGEVSRAFFTTKLKKAEPLNEVLILENDNHNLYFFSEVKNMYGKTIVHRWEYRGEKVFEKKFQVSKNSDKLISKYKLDPARTGEWMVVMADERGWPIKAVMFKFVKKGSFAGKGILPVKSR